MTFNVFSNFNISFNGSQLLIIKSCLQLIKSKSASIFQIRQEKLQEGSSKKLSEFLLIRFQMLTVRNFLLNFIGEDLYKFPKNSSQEVTIFTAIQNFKMSLELASSGSISVNIEYPSTKYINESSCLTPPQ